MRTISFPALSRRWVPWQGRATAADKALLAAITGALVIGLVVRPLRPFLIASHPVALEFLTGGPAAIGAAAAFARVGDLPLWLVVVAGVIGMIKLDWLIWWAGRLWGRGILGYFTTADRACRYAERARTVSPWVIGVAVVAAALPGVPSPLVFALAGLTRMRLVIFLALDAVGALLITGLITALGYGLGQQAVDVVLLIDRYAGWVSLAIIAGAVLVPLIRKGLRRLRVRTDRPTP
jgi:membrane protein DedA with SNARE-associated domain